jgi:heterotetrameric sarcosine oxidase gamma subunit
MKDAIFQSPFETARLEPAMVGSWQRRVERARGAAGAGDATDRGVMVIRGVDAADAAAAQYGPRLSEVGEVAHIELGLLAALREDLLMAITSDHASLREAFSGFQTRTHGPLLTATDMTHGRASLLLTGPSADDALARICALDFSPQAFPDLHAARTKVVDVPGIVVRHDAGRSPTYFLSVGRSYAGFLWMQVQEVLHTIEGVMLESSGMNALVGNWPGDRNRAATGMSI